MLGGLIVIVGIGGLAGVFFGGRLSERLLKRGHTTTRIVLPGVAMILAVACFAPAIWTTSVYFGIGMLTLAATFLAAANPAIDAARLDIIVPNLWGRAEVRADGHARRARRCGAAHLRLRVRLVRRRR